MKTSRTLGFACGLSMAAAIACICVMMYLNPEAKPRVEDVPYLSGGLFFMFLSCILLLKADICELEEMIPKPERKAAVVTAICLRRMGDKLQVLAEADGAWKTVIDRPWPVDGTGQLSHIAEMK